MIIRVLYDLDADQLHFITRHNLDRIRKTIWTPQTMLVYRRTHWPQWEHSTVTPPLQYQALPFTNSPLAADETKTVLVSR